MMIFFYIRDIVSIPFLFKMLKLKLHNLANCACTK